jgi:hypothetical protein
LKAERCQLTSVIYAYLRRRGGAVERGKILGIASAVRQAKVRKKVSDPFVMLEKCGLPWVHIQNITLSRAEYEI